MIDACFDLMQMHLRRENRQEVTQGMYRDLEQSPRSNRHDRVAD